MNLEKALGYSPKAESKPGASLVRVRLDDSALARVMEHWRKAAADRPHLRSLSRSEGDESRAWLNIVLDAGGQDARLCLEYPLSGASLPDFSAIWPYCRWWQEELTTFAGLKFEGAQKQGGVTWRLA